MGVHVWENRSFVSGGYSQGRFARMFMEEYLGRKLTKDEIVHHIDGDSLNDNIDNLQVLTRAEHSRLHNTGRVSSMKGKFFPKEVHLRMSKAHQNKRRTPHTIETKRKIRESYERTMRLRKEGIL